MANQILDLGNSNDEERKPEEQKSGSQLLVPEQNKNISKRRNKNKSQKGIRDKCRFIGYNFIYRYINSFSFFYNE
ncbi:MAG: hypothetical protein J6K45_07290 [Clostridia bacterium]|nr:hypothetical protein [Clostridia bacterium]